LAEPFVLELLGRNGRLDVRRDGQRFGHWDFLA
jgi:hypothetical protein